MTVAPLANAQAIALIEGGELEHYDPERGLMTIATSEAAEKHWARAKDPSKLYEAVEATLTEQRKFVRWWDGQPNRKGGGDHRNRPVTVPVAGRDGMPERMVIGRWRKRTADARFAKVLAEAQERCRVVVFNEEKIRGTQGTGENEWYTPPEHVARARAVLGDIDLDPASCDRAQCLVRAAHYFTRAHEGLLQQWHGRVWLNPPYAQPLISRFVFKMAEEFEAGRVRAAIMLTHNYTDTAWFHRAAGVASAICFTRGRVKFYEPDGGVASPTQGQAFFYFGDEVRLFAERFASIGFVLAPA